MPPAIPKVPEMKDEIRMVPPITAREAMGIPNVYYADRASAPSIMSTVLLIP
jgi:hypothetical protein